MAKRGGEAIDSPAPGVPRLPSVLVALVLEHRKALRAYYAARRAHDLSTGNVPLLKAKVAAAAALATTRQALEAWLVCDV